MYMKPFMKYATLKPCLMIGFENYVHLHQRNSKAPSPPGGNSTEGGVGGVHKKIIKEQI
jgi:hypothetical protein